MRSSRPVRRTVALGIVAGTILGFIDGLICLQHNASINLERYLLFYIGVPVLGWTTIAALAALGIGAMAQMWPPISSRASAIVLLYGLFAVSGLAVCYTFGRHLLEVLPASSPLAAPIGIGCTILLVAITQSLALASALGFSSLWEYWPGARTFLVGSCTIVDILSVAVVGHIALTEGRGVFYDPMLPISRVAGEINLVLISVDTLRTDAVSAYGASREQTPNIDRLARGGVVFERAIAPSPWTLPSVASFLTGVLPSRHGAGWSLRGDDLLARSPLRGDVPTLAGYLRQRGMRTQAIVTNPFLSTVYGLSRDFDGFENLTVEAEAAVTFENTLLLGALLSLWPSLRIDDSATTVSDRAIGWLRKHRDEHFFLWLHYIDPHAPYNGGTERQSNSFRGDLLRKGLRPALQVDVDNIDIARLRAGQVHLAADEKRALRSRYDGEVHFVDGEIGRVIEELSDPAFESSTLIVLLSDHGEEFWDHGGVEHGHALYDEVLRVPLVVRGPGVPAGLRISPMVRLIDLLPTILGAYETQPMNEIDGVSLIPLLRGEGIQGLTAVAESMLFTDDARALRDDNMKLIRYLDGREEMFDLGTDPGEKHNIAYCQNTREERRRLESLLPATLEHSHPEDAREPSGGAAIRARLRELGYAR